MSGPVPLVSCRQHAILARPAENGQLQTFDSENQRRISETYRRFPVRLFFNSSQPSALGLGCVKMQKNSDPSKIGLSKRVLSRFLGVGNGNPTHEYFEIWSFHTALGGSGRCHWCKSLQVPTAYMIHRSWLMRIRWIVLGA